MLGFRSNKLWKKILSITYLVFWGIMFLASMLDGKFKNITTYDFIISKIQNLILLIILASPYIFLSNTKLRSKMPLFKVNKKGKSFLGLIIVNIILFIVFGIVNGSHSKEYLADMANHDYQIIEQTEATCETPGTINYQCNYCGTTKSETIKRIERTEKTGDTNKNNKKDEADNKPSKMRIETKANSTSNADEKSIYKITVNGVEYVDAFYAFYSGVDLYMEGDGKMYKSFKIIEVKENLQQNDITCALGAKVSEYAYDGSGKIIDTYWKDADHMLNANRKLTGKPAYFVRRDQVKELKKVDIPTEEVKWLNLAGHIYPDVKIYIGSETTKRYLGKVGGINYKYQTFEIIYENGSREWKDRKEMISNNSLYVRADDPNLK